jgi:hypothetical protein
LKPGPGAATGLLGRDDDNNVFAQLVVRY